jgi:hypothetical protein
MRHAVVTSSVLLLGLRPLAVEAQTIASEHTWPGYGLLKPCYQFCYSACRASVTPSPSPATGSQCAQPSLYIFNAQPSKYKGLVHELGCSVPPCICNTDKWFGTLQTIYDCGRIYCHMRLGTQALPDEDFQKMLAVVRGYCESVGITLNEWILDIGKNYTPSPTSSTSSTSSTSPTSSLFNLATIILKKLCQPANVAKISSS